MNIRRSEGFVDASVLSAHWCEQPVRSDGYFFAIGTSFPLINTGKCTKIFVLSCILVHLKQYVLRSTTAVQSGHGSTNPNDFPPYDYLEMCGSTTGEKQVLMICNHHSGYAWLCYTSRSYPWAPLVLSSLDVPFLGHQQPLRQIVWRTSTTSSCALLCLEWNANIISYKFTTRRAMESSKALEKNFLSNSVPFYRNANCSQTVELIAFRLLRVPSTILHPKSMTT